MIKLFSRSMWTASGSELHSNGCYEIEPVIEKIGRPDWELAW